MPHRRNAFGYRWPMEGHDIVASLSRPDAYQRITPQHPGNHRENVDSPSPRDDAGWNTYPAAGKSHSPLRTLLHLELRADTRARFERDLRMGTASFAAQCKDEPSAFPFVGLEEIDQENKSRENGEVS